MGLMVCDLGVHFGNELRMYDLLEIIGELSSVLVFYVTDAVKYFFFFFVDWQFIINIKLSEQ